MLGLKPTGGEGVVNQVKPIGGTPIPTFGRGIKKPGQGLTDEAGRRYRGAKAGGNI